MPTSSASRGRLAPCRLISAAPLLEGGYDNVGRNDLDGVFLNLNLDGVRQRKVNGAAFECQCTASVGVVLEIHPFSKCCRVLVEGSVR